MEESIAELNFNITSTFEAISKKAIFSKLAKQ